jgi:serine/threonine-protein kinase
VSDRVHPIEEETTAGESRRPTQAEDLPWIFAGRYEIRALLGVGGMGSVYEALDRELEDVIALKIVRRELLRLADTVERFRREVRLARRITHPNVVRVYDLGEAEGIRYFTMERVPGRSLGQHIDGEGALAWDRWLLLARDVAAGLAAAHAAGVVHRDLKPDNVIVRPDGRAVLTDFGVARPFAAAASESTLMGIGTPAYMAPELFVDLAVADALCDIFSLGCLLFEAATGTLPWAGDDPIEQLHARLNADAAGARALRPDFPPAAAELLARCLSRDRGRRPASAVEVERALGALEAQLADEPPPSRAGTARGYRGTPAALAPPRRSSDKTVAVLPFEPAADADEDLAGGLTSVVIDALGRSAALRVRPRGQVEQHRRSRAPRRAIARELGARVIVEGTIARAGPLASIGVRAFAIDEDFPLWSARFSCDVGQLVPLGDAIAAGLTAALAEPSPPASAQAPDPRVAELLVRARGAYHAFWRQQAEAALALYEEARGIAPDDPDVLAGWALAALRVTFFTGASLDRARAAVARASAVAPDAPEVRVARASIALQDGDVALAVADAKRAVAAAPDLAEAQGLLGRILLELDLLPEGIRHLEWAVALEPALGLARWDLARAYALAGRWDDAERASGKAPGQLVGRWLDRARHALWRRDRDAARVHLGALGPEAATSTDDAGPMALASAILDLVANGTSPLAAPAYVAFRQQGAASPRRAAFVAQIDAEIAAFEGRRGDALAAIAAAADAGLGDLAWLMRCPLLVPLRDAPAFAAAAREVGARAARAREALFED